MRPSVKNIALVILALIAVTAWGLVIRQEIARHRHPKLIPPGDSVNLPAPGSGPTEETPVLEILGTITDAETGQPVVADVQAANVHIDDVTEFRLIFPLSRPPVSGTPASDQVITITVTAPGYRKWSVDIKPHLKRSKKINASIKLQPARRPEPDEGPTHDQA